MSAHVIQITFLVFGIALLACMGILAQRRVKKHEDMSVGGRSFNCWSIFFSLYAFWGGNTIAGTVELAHRDGIASAWFGIVRTVELIVIVLVTGSAFRKLAMITLPNFIAQRFGSPVLKLLGGIITALNFTIFTVSSVVGAAAFFSAILGWPLWASATFTVGSFVVYTLLGGMHAISYNGKILVTVQMLALLIAAVAGIKMAGWHNIMNLEPRYFDIMPPSYPATITAWFYAFAVNAFVAQAALQIVMSCETINAGRKGLLYVLLGYIPIVILAPIAGMAAKVLFPTIKSVQAMPMLASSMPSVVLSTIVVTGLYFTTLGWASSCILSGATVAANDIYGYFVPNASSTELIRVGRVAVLILSALTVGLAILIPSGVAFWAVAGFVVRDTALFPLIVIGLFWNAISRRAALAAAVVGPCIGIAWYIAKYPDLLLDAHPMFVGMIASIVVITVSTLFENGVRMRFKRSRKGVAFALFAMAGVLTIAVWGPELLKAKLLPAAIGYTIYFLFIAVVFLIQRADEKGSALEVPLSIGEC
ncbi:MAG: sodium:solute symporter family protein [Syntrophobacteraceae bacterium]